MTSMPLGARGPRIVRKAKIATDAVARPADDLSLRQRVWRAFVRSVYGRAEMPVYPIDLVRSRLPIGVGTEIINICNADCSFCGYGKGEDGKAADPRVKGKLKPEVFRHALKLFSESGGGIFVLTPILGEVSAHPGWLDMVREARSWANVSGVSCFTNAILLDRFGSQAILESGLTQINVSTALTSREAYNRLYGVDKYDVVLKNIIDLLETNRRLGEPVYIDIHLRIDKPFENFLASDVYKRLALLIDPRRIRLLDDDWDDFHGVIGKEGLPVGHKFKEQYVDKRVPCYAMFRKLEVLTDGTIQACACRVEPELWGGNILNYERLEDAWRDPGLEKLRNNWFDGKISKCCERCSHYIPYTNLLSPAKPRRVLRRLLSNARRALVRRRANA